MRTTNTIGGGWDDYIKVNEPKQVDFENLHAMARDFLISNGYDVSQYTVDVSMAGRCHYTVKITPRLPSFSAEWDNSWNPS